MAEVIEGTEEVSLEELVGAVPAALEGGEVAVEDVKPEPAVETAPAVEPEPDKVADVVEGAVEGDTKPKGFLAALTDKARAAMGGAKESDESAHLRTQNAQLTQQMLDTQASEIKRLREEVDAEYDEDDKVSTSEAEATLARRQAASSVFAEKFNLEPEAANALVATISEFAKIESENQRRPELTEVRDELAKIQATTKQNEQYQSQYRTIGQGLVELANQGEKQAELVQDYAERGRESVLMRWYFKDTAEADRVNPNAPLPPALLSVEAIVFHGNKLVKELVDQAERLGVDLGDGAAPGIADKPATGATQATAGTAITRPTRHLRARDATEEQLNEVLGELDEAANASGKGLADLIAPM